MAAEIRNYVKEAAHKSLWLGIVNQSIPREGDNATECAVQMAFQSYFFSALQLILCGPGVDL